MDSFFLGKLCLPLGHEINDSIRVYSLANILSLIGVRLEPKKYVCKWNKQSVCIPFDSVSNYKKVTRSLIKKSQLGLNETMYFEWCKLEENDELLSC